MCIRDSLQADAVRTIYFINADIQSHIIHGGRILFLSLIHIFETLVVKKKAVTVPTQYFYTLSVLAKEQKDIS